MNTNEERARKRALDCIEWVYGKGEHQDDVNYITHQFMEMATEQKAIDIDKACADNVITDIGKAMLDPTISCKTKAELVRVILTKAMEE